MSVALSDGSTARTVHLSLAIAPNGVASVGDSIWMLSKGSPTVAVRKVRTGEMTAKIDLLEDGVAIATVGSRVWIATSSNKVYVFGQDGSLLGALQSAGLPLIRRFFVLASDVVFSVGGGKDFARWDPTQFTVERTFFGTIPGESVTWVAAANNAATSVIASTSHAIRMYTTVDGNLLAEIHEGASSVCVINPEHSSQAAVIRMRPDGTIDDDYRQGDNGAVVWAAQAGWITVFSLEKTTRTAHFIREKTVPCAGVKELSLISAKRICGFDSEGLITIWSTIDCTPQRSFKTTGAVGVSSAATSFSCLAAYVTSAIVWTIGDGKALIWGDEIVRDADDGAARFDYVKDLERDEIQFLRRKINYMESVSRLFRDKVKTILGGGASGSPNGGQRQAAAPAASPVRALIQQQQQSAFDEVDTLYDNALNAWDDENAAHEPLPPYGSPHAGSARRVGVDRFGSQPDSDFTEYWKQKHAEAEAELQKLRLENDNLVSLMHQQQGSTNDVEVKRAHHICQVIKEKNELRERERQLSEDVARLRAKLREFNSPLASAGPLEDIDALREQNKALREELNTTKAKNEKLEASAGEVANAQKHNHILKQRVKKLRADLDDAQRVLSEANASNQFDVERLLSTISLVKADADAQRDSAAKAEDERRRAQLVAAERDALVDKYRVQIEAVQRELAQRESVERAAHNEVRNEMTMLCQSLDDRDRRIAAAQQSLSSMAAQLREQEANAQRLAAEREAAAAENEVLRAHIAQLEDLTSDRKQYARTVGELQGRMEMAIEELRRSFTPVQFAESVTHLEGRMANLCALEAQLRQKDDVIAMRDDQLLTLHKHLKKLEDTVAQVSSVFVHLPKSIEEVELLMVEVDEYRRRLGVDPETQELIQIRLLELQAKRKAGEPVPLLQDVFPDRTRAGKSAAELERIKILSDTVSGLFSAAVKDDKTGLVRTPAPGARSAAQQPAEPPVSKQPAAAAAAVGNKTAAAPAAAPVAKKWSGGK